MKTHARNAASRRSVTDRSDARPTVSRLTVTTLRIPRHTASAAMLSALAGIAFSGTVASTGAGAEAACRTGACIQAAGTSVTGMAFHLPSVRYQAAA